MDKSGHIHPIVFGTDGWRAVIGDEFTFANVDLLARGFGEWFLASNHRERPVLIGYDTRFLSDEFATTISESLSRMSIQVFLSESPIPTPALSWSVTDMNAGAGIMVTASHNPARYNGIKIKTSDGMSAAEGVTDQILDVVGRVRDRLDGHSRSNSTRVILKDFMPSYIQQIASQVDLELIKNSELSVVVDGMHGAGSGIFSQIFYESNVSVHEIRRESNPLFPNMRAPEPIAINLSSTMEYVGADNKIQCGFAFDGDADRFGLVDEAGQFISSLDTFSLLTDGAYRVRGDTGPVVRSLTMSTLVDRIAEAYGQQVFETKVGFKYLAPVMLEKDALIAGEESGGTAFRGHVRERDGPLSALRIMELMATTKKPPGELLRSLHQLYGERSYDRYDLAVTSEVTRRLMDRLESEVPNSIGELSVIGIDRIDGFRYLLENNSWAAVRLSGTEPLVRVYAETENRRSTELVIEDIVKSIEVQNV